MQWSFSPKQKCLQLPFEMSVAAINFNAVMKNYKNEQHFNSTQTLVSRYSSCAY